MRTSSVKSIASALTLAIALTIVPVADARPTQVRSNRGGRNEGIVRLVINFLKRVGQLTANGGPSIPIGKGEENVTPDPLAPTTGSGDTSQ